MRHDVASRVAPVATWTVFGNVALPFLFVSPPIASSCTDVM